ncbi:hypothetical protein FQA47_014651 [Oryzias melastigma]|uniref:Uncharacterized protein n=1 Tax=Oryzias melastigma TaxID=30732 RepID=A0A834KZ37_ORYME|nr:hypothetical protein FQA47_014651 [Oryzias melastigma]
MEPRARGTPDLPTPGAETRAQTLEELKHSEPPVGSRRSLLVSRKRKSSGGTHNSLMSMVSGLQRRVERAGPADRLSFPADRPLFTPASLPGRCRECRGGAAYARGHTHLSSGSPGSRAGFERGQVVRQTVWGFFRDGHTM